MGNEFESSTDCTEESYSVNDLLFPNEKDSTSFEVAIASNFPAQLYKSEIVISIIGHQTAEVQHLNTAIINRISKKMRLHFSRQGKNDLEDSSSPVCYAGSSEVIDDFKMEVFPQSFSEINVLDYTCGVLWDKLKWKSNAYLTINDLSNVPYPLSQVSFWKWVKEGETLRKQYAAPSE